MLSKPDKIKFAKILARAPLEGVLDISKSLKRYDILEACWEFLENETFKKYGFNIRISDDWNKIRKIEWFVGNEAFCQEHKLLDKHGKPSRLKYLLFMKGAKK